MIREGVGFGRCFLAAPRNGAARPTTVASTISQTRYSATSQVQSFRCTNAHRPAPEFISSSFTAVDFARFTYPASRGIARPAPFFCRREARAVAGISGAAGGAVRGARGGRAGVVRQARPLVEGAGD